MKMRIALAALVAALALTGCGSGSGARAEPDAVADGANQPRAKGSEPVEAKSAEKQPGPVGKGPDEKGRNEGQDEVKKIAKSLPRPNPEALKIQPARQDGWARSTVAAADLAREVDRAIRSLKDTVAEVTLLLDTPEGHGRSVTTSRIRNLSTYNVQYNLPKTNVVTHVVLADGKHRARQENDSWQRAITVDTPSQLPAGAAFAAEWLEAFPRHAYGALTERADTFGDLVRALPLAGFAVEVEQKTISSSGDPRLFRRILASQSAGERANIEIRVDCKYNLPVTIRLLVPGDPGTKITWSARYAFGQKFEDSVFTIPALAR